MNEIDDDGLRALFRRLDRPSSPADRRAKRRAIAEVLGGAVPRRVGGRYELEGVRLGAGGMGVVHSGRDTTLGRRVAIKRVRHAADDASLHTLEREARTLASLSHPNIVTVHDVVVEGDDVYVVMELVEGQALREWLVDEHSRAEVLAIFEQVGRGIAAAHGAGIIHRDVKPSNVMVATNGTAKVIDFGLARAAEPLHTPVSTEDAASSPTRWTQGAGTPPYMAPEQRRGATVVASDQFGFCVSLFEGLTGELPFARGQRSGVRDDRDRVRLLQTLRRAGVPRPVRRAVVRGLAVAPADRFESMEALLAALAPARGHGAWWAVGLCSALAFGVMLAAPPYDRCGHVEAAASTWTAERYDRLQASLTERYGPKAAAELREGHERWLAGWRERARSGCEADEARTSAAAARQRLCAQEGFDRVEVFVAALADGTSTPRDPQRLLDEVTSAECDDQAWALVAATPGTFEHADPSTMRRVHELFVSSLDGDLDHQIDLLQSLIERGSLEPTVRAWATARLANALTMSNEPDRAVALVEPLLIELEGAGDPILQGLLQAEAAAALAKLPGREVEALSLARRAVAAMEGSPRGEPHRASVLGALAVASLQTGRAQDALDAANRGLGALSARPRGPVLTRTRDLARAQLLHLRARAYEELGRAEAVGSYHEALRSIEASVPRHPDRARILTNLGVLVGKLGDPYQADEYLRRAIALEQAAGLPTDAAMAAMDLGNVWLRAERFDRAAEWYDEAWAQLPDDADASLRAKLAYNGAIAQQLAGRPEAAAEGYTEALSRSARDPAALELRYGAHLGRGLALLDRERLELARRDFEDALAIEPAAAGSVDRMELRLGLWITEDDPEGPAAARWIVQAREAIDRDPTAAKAALLRWSTRFEATGRRWPPTISAPLDVPP